jgi:hypothetical protein
MTRSGVAVIVAILLTFVGTVAAQSPTPTPRPSVNRLENLQPLNDRDDNDLSRRTSIENIPPEYRISSKAEKRAKLTEQEKTELKDSRRNGLKAVKMYVAPKCAEKLVVDVSDPACSENYDLLPISYFSFFDGMHGQLYADVRLSDGTLIAGRGLYVQGFLVDLGDAGIAALDKRSENVVKLAGYPVAKTTSEAEKQLSDLEKGIVADGIRLVSKQKLAAGRSFLLRIVAYGAPDSAITPYNFDAVLALRVERMTSDNMAIIVWKKLSEKTAPRLKSKD